MAASLRNPFAYRDDCRGADCQNGAAVAANTCVANRARRSRGNDRRHPALVFSASDCVRRIMGHIAELAPPDPFGSNVCRTRRGTAAAATARRSTRKRLAVQRVHDQRPPYAVTSERMSALLFAGPRAMTSFILDRPTPDSLTGIR